MEQSSLLKVLNQMMEETHFPCEWWLAYQEGDAYLVLTLQFHLANPEKKGWRDPFGTVSHQVALPYEVQVIYYQPGQVEVYPANVLKAFPVDSRYGLAAGDLLTCVKYLKRLAVSARSRWEDYLLGSQDQPFGLEWRDDAFNEVKESLQSSVRYSDLPVYFPHDISD